MWQQSHWPRPCSPVTDARAAQLLRGIATAMSIDDFSVAVQWRPFAEAALQSVAPPKPSNGPRVHNWCVWLGTLSPKTFRGL